MRKWHWRAALKALWGIPSPSAEILAYQRGYAAGLASIRGEVAALKTLLRVTTPGRR